MLSAAYTQLVQGAEPAAGLKVPCAHAAHGPPCGPVNPGTHSQSVRAVLAPRAVEFGGHARQSDVLSSGA